MRLVLCLLLAFVGLVLAKNTYIATVPKQIRAGSSARICLSALKRSDRQVTIFVTILDKQNGTIATAQAQRNLRQEKNSNGFDVERVVLPKFEVNVVLPSFELKTDRFFTVTINALYTFGKPVQGEAELTIKRRWTRNTKDQIVKKFKINGKATIRVLMSEIEPRLGTYIEVIAKVTETIAGISANDTGNVQIYDTPEKLTFSSSMSSFFKPGLDYTIILRATQRDDSPLNPPLGFVNITVTYTVPGERKPQNGLPSPGGNQIMPLPFPQPINTDTNVLWTRLEQIPESGLIVLSARFPKAAQSGRIEVFKEIYESTQISFD